MARRSTCGTFGSSAAEAGASGPRLLVVEDDPVNRRALLKTLEHLGYAADVAANGREALVAVESVSYPLVLMDCEMPVLDGYRAATEIRKHEHPARRMIIIAVTGHPLAGERERILASGMDDCIAKPVDVRALSRLLEEWLPTRHEPVSASSRPARSSSSLVSFGAALRQSESLAGVFLEHIPAQLLALELALDSGDDEALRFAAHTVKGSCLALGIRRMAFLSAALESNPANSGELYADLLLEAARVCARLETTRMSRA